MKRVGLGLALVVGMAAVSGCGKDRTPEDWRRDKVAEYLAETNKIAGTYRGQLRAANDGSAFGSAELQVAADTEVSASRDTRSTEPQAGLKGQITLYLGSEVRRSSFRGGYYDAGSGDFQAEVRVPGGEETVSISGRFEGGAVTGRIEVASSSERAGDFFLHRDGPLPSSEGLGNSRIGVGRQAALRYQGTARFFDGQTAPMELNLSALRASLDQEFLDVFSSRKYVSATITKNGRTRIQFQNAQWDQRLGALNAVTAGESGSQRDRYEAYLRCRQTAAGWDCDYATNALGTVFSCSFVGVL